MRKLLFATLATSLAVLPGLRGDAQTLVNTNVTVDTTWSGTIVLDGAIFVKSGATLTINPGTIVRGQPRTGLQVAGETLHVPGALIVTKEGTIIADGAANNPIIMTTAAVDNNGPLGAGPPDNVADDDDGNGFKDEWTGPGDLFLDDTPTTAPLSPLAPNGTQNVALWGGLVVLGEAGTNCETIGGGICTVEGLAVPGFPVTDVQYGGITDGDSSGSLSYISVRHAGDEIGASNELNGVTLAGVGSGTDFHHIDIYTNFDDGIEWFGGAVNGDHLNVAFIGDDSFDLDQGYRGTNQFASAWSTFFNVQGGGLYGTSSGDKGCEWDGDDWDETGVLGTGDDRVVLDGAGKPTPFSNTTFWNVTIAGSVQPGVPTTATAAHNGHTNDNDGCEVRNGFAGTLNNAIIYNTSDGAGTSLDRQGWDDAGAGTDTAPPGGADDFRTPANAIAGLIHVHDLTCDDVLTYPVAVSDTAEENEILSGEAAPGLPDDANAGFGSANIGCNGVNDAGYGLRVERTNFVPTGLSGKLDPSLGIIDPRPRSANATMTGVAPSGAVVDTSATYRGAFPPFPAGSLWTDGWTAQSVAGMLPEPGAMSSLAAGVVLLMLLKRRR